MDSLLSAFSNSVSEKRKCAYVRATQDIPYETLRRAVSSVIRSWSQSSIPPIAAIRDRCVTSNQEYPVARHRARDVAIRRLAYRDIHDPSEEMIRLEFQQFPEVLGPYVPPMETLESGEAAA
jgi:hypothetical protein